MTFSMLGGRADFDRLVSVVVNQFAGMLCRVTLTEDPTLYAVGILEAEPTYDPKTGTGLFALSCTDGDAFINRPSSARVYGCGNGVNTVYHLLTLLQFSDQKRGLKHYVVSSVSRSRL